VRHVESPQDSQPIHNRDAYVRSVQFWAATYFPIRTRRDVSSFKHRLENLGDTAYDAVYVGVKNKAASATNAQNPAAALKEAKRIVAESLLATGQQEF
jgi:uncharacterized protein YyaL (SSP411 family)